MNKAWLLILVSFQLFAQELPVSESNYFVYNKYNFGVDLNNISTGIHETASGEIVCSEYSGHIYKIGNTSLHKALPELKEKNPLLINYFKMPNGIEYYCTNEEIIITKNQKIKKRIFLNSQNSSSYSFQIQNTTLFFSTFNYTNNSLEIRAFDGKNATTLLKLKPDKTRFFNQLFVNEKINLVDYIGNKLVLYELKNNHLHELKSYTFSSSDFVVKKFTDVNNFIGSSTNDIFQCKNGILTFFKQQSLKSCHSDRIFLTKKGLQYSAFQFYNSKLENLFSTTFSSGIYIPKQNHESNSYYCGTTTSFLRFFPHIKKYPRLFNNSNSNAVFTLTQDHKNRVWAGSYQGALSVIENDKVVQSKHKDIMFMNGGLPYKDKMMLFGESQKGAFLFSDANNYKIFARDNTFFYAYVAKNNILYLGSTAKGLWFTNAENIEKTDPKWNIVGEKQGLKLFNILTICEDKFGNIWTGRTTQGVAVYNPETKKAKTWLTQNKEIGFGSMAITKDTKNTLWLGLSKGGLAFYDGKSKNDFDAKNFVILQHPLLEHAKEITFLHQWKDFLILGGQDQILLFDLQKWYASKIVSVRYLNPMELNISGTTEQNTIFTDKRDESIWFATSDMVYQWDIKKWLTLPKFKVNPSILIKKDSVNTAFNPKKCIEFKPTENSFDVQIYYQTRDNMPRFINGVLVKKDEKPIFDRPNLQTQFHFANLSSGEYVFYVRVCQQDGSFEVFEYPIKVNHFLWQNWWFWGILSLFPIGFLLLYFQKRNQIEQQKKKLSQLNLSSLSNQFRPHFMLNALNSIGSQMEGKPHAEKVISRLGESINIIYGFTQKGDFTISFQNEWKLVENSIEIQRLLFIPELVVEIYGQDLLPENYKIPIGLLQIPIENALLHGLRNKTDGNCLLEINFSESIDFYTITITDNGVGRNKASQMNNFKKNGKGLKTVFEMIKIINQHQDDAIDFTIIDLKNDAGTRVKIYLNKTIDYEKIKL